METLLGGAPGRASGGSVAARDAGPRRAGADVGQRSAESYRLAHAERLRVEFVAERARGRGVARTP